VPRLEGWATSETFSNRIASMNMRSVMLLLLLAASAGTASAQPPDGHRRVKVRATLSGSSDTSEAGSYKVYSGVAVDVAIAGDLGSSFALELAGRIESREVDGPGTEALAERLGSLVMVPVSLLGQWRPGVGRDSGFQPYVGGGFTTTFTFEKSGALDSVTVPCVRWSDHSDRFRPESLGWHLAEHRRAVGHAQSRPHRPGCQRAQGESRSAGLRDRHGVRVLDVM
jgi:hypothetical protein